jgi:DNA-binding PadR family transcriptional regulator
MLTHDETRAAAYAIALHLEDRAFVPHDEFLPTCERLRERGWLSRRMDDGEPVYELTQSGRVALELHRLGNPSNASLN